MSIETALFEALRGLVADRVYPDLAPENTVRPYITYQQVGGDAVNFVENTIPSKKNARMQINVWADTRLQATAMAGTVEDVLRTLIALQPTVLGAAIAAYDDETKLRGTLQYFSLWI
ncbi:DUF3168 domain-containing protein [Janthinobacterium sp.]|uniref:DUF3168 domain-containing protein n=1 Tax=Janthinobacterium sp. TaxID=1871054 RepID=UPI00260F9B7B|nr:DUF3168 domain-containing protein [Janthinobacterium sp.]